MVIESMLSSIEELTSRITEPENPGCAINYCPFCSSSLVRIDNIGTAGHRYKCGDCDMKWTMIDPVI
jgi:transposase-like protein